MDGRWSVPHVWLQCIYCDGRSLDAVSSPATNDQCGPSLPLALTVAIFALSAFARGGDWSICQTPCAFCLLEKMLLNICGRMLGQVLANLSNNFGLYVSVKCLAQIRQGTGWGDDDNRLDFFRTN